MGIKANSASNYVKVEFEGELGNIRLIRNPFQGQLLL